MIEVKALRPQGGAGDPADPLGLRAEVRGGTRLLSGFVVGMSALAIYLKSFLWSSPQAAVGEEPHAPRPAPVDEPLDIRGATAVPAARRTDALTEREARDRAEDAADPAPARHLTVVFSPFETGIIAPTAVVKLSIGLPQIAANAPLPPFAFAAAASRAAATPLPADTPAVFALPEAEDAIAIALDPADEEEEAGEPEPAERNRAPRNSGPVHLGDVGSGATLAIALSQLLANTTDPDGDPLTVTNLRAGSGTLLSTSSGWRLLADPDELGEVTLSYTVGDGTHQVQQTARATIVENGFSGTDGADLIVGTDGRDVIRAGGGDDNLVGNAGRDILLGEVGDDLIAGGAGADSLWGGDGDDVIAGGAGDDWISGGAGNDHLYGEAGDDLLAGDAGDDLLDGGEGADLLLGGEGADTLLGQSGDDILRGEAGSDLLDGGAGGDLLSGGEGLDTVLGGAGDDHVVADDDSAHDLYDGGAGHDTLDFSGASAPVTVDIAQAVALGETIGADSFDGFEHYVGSAGSDTFVGGAGDATLTGNGGADQYSFAQGDFVELPPSHYRIADFGLDDLISITAGGHEKQIRKAQKSLEDRIEDFFEDVTEEAGADEPRLRFSHDWTDDYRLTVIEVDFDRDRITDLEIRLDGEFRLVTEHA